MARVTEDLLARLKFSLGRGRHSAKAGAILAAELGITERTIRALAHELRLRGVLVGSLSDGGYFLIVDGTDLEVGTHHLMSRVREVAKVYRVMRRAAIEELGEYVQGVFVIDETEEAIA